MRQPSQKYSIKDDERKKRLHSNHLAQQVLQQEPKILQSSMNSNHDNAHTALPIQKSHDSQTQQIYDIMNLQNKQSLNGGLTANSSVQRQLNLKIPLVQKQILNNNLSGNSKLSSQTNPHMTMGNNQTSINLMEDSLQQIQNHYQLTMSNNPQSFSALNNPVNPTINSNHTGSFFRQAALSQFLKEPQNHSPDPPQTQSQISACYQSSFDHSDKSTTANTGFPLFSTKTSVFQRKVTQNSNQLSSTQQQNPNSSMNNNFNQTTSVLSNNGSHSTQTNINDSSLLNQLTSQIGSLQITGQGQRPRGLNQISRAYRQMQMNDTQQIENSSISRSNFQVQGETIGGVAGSNISAQQIQIKNNLQSYLAIDKIKSQDKNPYTNSQNINNQNLSNQSNPGGSNIGGGFMNISIGQNSTNINSSAFNQSSLQASYISEDQGFHATPSLIGGNHNKQHSPQSKYITGRARLNEAQQSIQQKLQQIVQQPYPNSQAQNISHNDSLIQDTSMNQQQIRDIKIRKGFHINQQKIQKPQNLRFQTAQLILDKQQQQQQQQTSITQSNLNSNTLSTIQLAPISIVTNATPNPPTQMVIPSSTQSNATSGTAQPRQSSTSRHPIQPQQNNNCTTQPQIMSLLLQPQNSGQTPGILNSSSKNELEPIKDQVGGYGFSNISFDLQSRHVRKLTNDSISAMRQSKKATCQLHNRNNINCMNSAMNNSNILNDDSGDESTDKFLNLKKDAGSESRNSSKPRKISNGQDKEQIILKTLNLEERKRLIRKHQKLRQQCSRNDDDYILEDEKQQKKVNTVQMIQNTTKQKEFDTNSSEKVDELAVIEEEVMNDDLKSQLSKIKTIDNIKTSRLVSQSFTTLSSGHRFIDNATLQLPLVHLGNQKLRNNNMGQFKKAMFKSEAFKIIYKKIKEGVINKGSPEYEKVIDKLSKISGLSPLEIELCVEISLQQRFTERFQNPYNKVTSSSYETIEENIASVSLSHSFTYGNMPPLVGRSQDMQSFQPSSGSSIWHVPLGFGNILNGVYQSNNGLGGSHKQQKNQQPIEDFKKPVKESKSNGNASDKRSKYSINNTSSKKIGSESLTSGSRDLNTRRRLNNMRSQGSYLSTERNMFKMKHNKSSESIVINQRDLKEQQQSLHQLTQSDDKAKSDEKESVKQREPLHQLQQQQKGMTLEQIKLRNQSLQPKLNDTLNIYKASIQEKNSKNIVGQLVKWRELKKIGQGTQGEVFIAQNVKNFNFFVVKKLSLFSVNAGIDKEALMKLKKEIEVYRKLEHHNVIKYIGSEIVNNQFCIYLEYMSSGSLQNIYQSYGALQESTIKTFVRQILNGLIYLHENKVIHCDLKGANVLVDHNGIVKLSDFGCSKLFESSFSMSDFNCAIRGSLPWMAPEIVMNKGIRRKADIWSLGCMMIELAVGGNPWGNMLSSNNFQAIFKIADPNSKPSIPDNLSHECQDFINQCLIRDYEKRPSALELQNHVWFNDSLPQLQQKEQPQWDRSS